MRVAFASLTLGLLLFAFFLIYHGQIIPYRYDNNREPVMDCGGLVYWDGTLYWRSWKTQTRIDPNVNDETRHYWIWSRQIEEWPSVSGGSIDPVRNFRYRNVRQTTYTISIWPIPLLLIGLSMWRILSVARTRNLRERDNLCLGCGYSLQGLTQPRCPECGTPFAPKDMPKETP